MNRRRATTTAAVLVLLLAAVGATGATSAAGSSAGAAGRSVSTTAGAPVNETAAVVVGSLDELGAGDAAVVWFEYRKRGARDWSGTTGRTLDSPGRFRAQLTGLEPGTDYEFRAATATGRGAVRTLITPDYPAVEVGEVAPRNQSVVDVQVRMTDLGAPTAALEVQYREAGTAPWRSTARRTVESPGNLSVAVAGLDANTTYEYRAFVHAADGERDVSGVATARTDEAVTIQTLAAADVNASAATFRGRVVHSGRSNVTSVRFRYRLRGWRTWLETGPLDVADDGTFEMELVGLDPNATYQFGAVVETADGDAATGRTRNVTTDPVEHPPFVDRLDVGVRAVAPVPPLLHVGWAVSDSGGNLSSVTVVVRNASGRVVRRVESPVDGPGDSGAMYIRVGHPRDDSLTVTVVVEDAAGNTARRTTTV